jgi:hypothetical protein
MDNIRFVSQAEYTNTNHGNLHLLNVALSVHVLNLITSFCSVRVLCYTYEKDNNLPNATANSMQAYGVPLPCHKDCK